MSGHHPPAERLPSDSQKQQSAQSTGQPPSFKTNVNRMKTKRWVNAKTYSYDGDDWGDSDSGDDDDDDEINKGQSQGLDAKNPHRPWHRDTQNHGPTSRPFQPPATNMSQNASRIPPMPVGANRFDPEGTPKPIPTNQTSSLPDPGNPPTESSLNHKPLGPGETISTTDGNQQGDASEKPLPFIRPADIYKRLAEEREKERSNESEPSEPSARHEPQAASPVTQGERSIPGGSAEPDNLSTYHRGDQTKGSSVDEAVDDHTHLSKSLPRDTAESQKPSGHSTAPVSSSSSQLPLLKRLSGLGEELAINTDNPEATNKTAKEATEATEATEGPPGIRHNPSAGFRSVVHQAFDTPGTPNTTTGSIIRSDSENTTTISPVIPSIAQGTDTPTIKEAPSDQDAHAVNKRESNIVPPEFIPGHRRSLTPPSPDNSPAKRPVVRTSDVPTYETLNISETTPPGCQASSSPGDTGSGHIKTSNPGDTAVKGLETSRIAAGSTADKESPSLFKNDDISNTPKAHDENLQIDTGHDRGSPTSRANNTPLSDSHLGTPHGHEPAYNDSLQSTSPSTALKAEHPEQPETSSAEEPPSNSQHESTFSPSEYNSYWAKQEDNNSLKPLPLAPLSARSAGPQGSEKSSRPSSGDKDHPQSQLKKQFSWEMERAGTASAASQGSTAGNDGPNTSTRTGREVPAAVSAADNEGSIQNGDPKEDNPVKPLQILQPSPVSHEDLSKPPQVGSEPRDAKISDDSVRPITGHDNVQPVETADETATTSSGNPQDLKKIIGFREIMGMKTYDQKITAFNQTRQNFATTDTGIDNWTRHMADSYPEHSDLVAQNGALPPGSDVSHRPSPPRGKFPKLSSLGSISLPTGQHDSSGSSQGHARHASRAQLTDMMNSQQVQAKGKDLLHSAGVLGGKAGGAAKGLFAKSKSRFRNSGSEKVDPLSLPIEPRPISQGSKGPRPSIDNSAATSTERHGDIPRVGSLKLDFKPFCIDGMTTTPDNDSSQKDLPPIPSSEESKSSVFGSSTGQFAETMKESDNDMNRPPGNHLHSPNASNSKSNPDLHQAIDHSPLPKPGPPTEGDKHDLSMPGASGRNEPEPVETQARLNVGSSGSNVEHGHPAPPLGAQEARSTTQLVSKSDVKTPRTDVYNTVHDSQLDFESPESPALKPPNSPTGVLHADGELPVNDNSKLAGKNTAVGRSTDLHVSDDPPSLNNNATNPDSTAQTIGRKFSFEQKKLDAPKPPPKTVAATANEARPAPKVPPKDGRQAALVNPRLPRNNTTSTATSSEHGVNSNKPEKALWNRDTKAVNSRVTPKPGVSANTVSQNSTDVPKTRSRSSSAFSGMMSKVYTGLQKEKDVHTKNSLATGGKRGNLRFRSLRLDTRLQKERGSEVERHTSPRTDSANPASPESRRADIVGSFKRMQHGMARGSNHATNGNHDRNGNNSKAHDSPGRLSKTPKQSKYPNRPRQSTVVNGAPSPSQKHSDDDSKPLPATPRGPRQSSPTTRSSRYYQTLNPTLSQVTENPEPNPASGSGARSSYMPHRPRTSSLGHSPANPTLRSPLADSVRFPLPPSTNENTSERPLNRSHTADLHIRSRSPMSRPPNPHQNSSAVTDSSDPANNLGKFDSRKPDSVEGQERPWEISLPQNQDDTNFENSRTQNAGATQHPLPESTTMSPINPAAEDVAPPPPPKIPHDSNHQSNKPWDYSATALQKAINEAQAAEAKRSTMYSTSTMEPVELPANDNSSEEIIMSSTAYPGQQWQPAYLESWY